MAMRGVPFLKSRKGLWTSIHSVKSGEKGRGSQGLYASSPKGKKQNTALRVVGLESHVRAKNVLYQKVTLEVP